MKVVVIGNSRDLLDRDDGAKIDACDRIIRINSFRLHGYERQVGSRIDTVSICLSLSLVRTALVHSADLICQARELWTPSWRGQASDVDITLALKAVKCRSEQLVFCDDTGHKDVIMRTYALTGEAPFFPTTGLQTLHLAAARFPAADLRITGFGLNSPLDLRRFDTSGVGIWPGHNIAAERQYLLKGLAAGSWQRL
jgi:hypothetical protein